MTGFIFSAQRYPTGPGCYLMKDARGEVIYIGKAKNLRRRLASYFRQNPAYRKVERLVTEIEEIEIILAHNEVESLVLENNLIKRYRPQYNSFLKSDKSGYPYIILTREEYPRYVRFKRNLMNKSLKGLQEADCTRRFGPYLSYQFAEELVDYVNGKFSLRVCDPLPSRACLLYHMGKCSAPCEKKISVDEYAHQVEKAAHFLSQTNTTLIEHLKAHMQACAERLEFERAQRIKDQLEALQVGMAQQVVERDIDYDQAVLYFGKGKVMVAEIRKGILTRMELCDLEKDNEPVEALYRFINLRYGNQCPAEIIHNCPELSSKGEALLAETIDHPVRFRTPGQEPEVGLLSLCEINYNYRVK